MHEMMSMIDDTYLVRLLCVLEIIFHLWLWLYRAIQYNVLHVWTNNTDKNVARDIFKMNQNYMLTCIWTGERKNDWSLGFQLSSYLLLWFLPPKCMTSHMNRKCICLVYSCQIEHVKLIVWRTTAQVTTWIIFLFFP